MEVNVLLFGQLAEIAGTHSVTLQDIEDSDALSAAINRQYPAMAGIRYMVAVDKKIIRENTTITAQTGVALLPPFSGG